MKGYPFVFSHPDYTVGCGISPHQPDCSGSQTVQENGYWLYLAVTDDTQGISRQERENQQKLLETAGREFHPTPKTLLS